MQNIGENEATSLAESSSLDKPQTELAEILREGEDPEVAVARIEKVAELAPRWKQAMRTILMTFTFPEDWETFGEGDKAKVCLSSAGAERVAQQFSIQFYEVADRLEEWTDEYGKAVRFIYTGKARLGEKVVFAQGNYSTRDEFLGKAAGEWKSTSDINLGNIRNAAYHRFVGNAIKALLGLRALPVREYQELMSATGQRAERTTRHAYGKGTKGGTSPDDRPRQVELAKLCVDLVNEDGLQIITDAKGESRLELIDAEDGRSVLEVAKDSCIAASAFLGKDKSGAKKLVTGLPASQLSGKRLDITLAKVKKLKEDIT